MSDLFVCTTSKCKLSLTTLFVKKPSVRIQIKLTVHGEVLTSLSFLDTPSIMGNVGYAQDFRDYEVDACRCALVAREITLCSRHETKESHSVKTRFFSPSLSTFNTIN